MSFESENTLDECVSEESIKDLLKLLGYVEKEPWLSLPNAIGFYSWRAVYPQISYTGVELIVYKEEGKFIVHTRTRSSCSYWDALHQNETIRYFNSFLGGNFVTDSGESEYNELDEGAPSFLDAGLYHARDVFYGQLQMVLIQLTTRSFNADFAEDELSDLGFMNDINPRFLANSLILPYIIGAWEQYCRESYIVFLKYQNCGNKAYTKNLSRLNSTAVKKIIGRKTSLEQELAENLSFQRPSIIDKNFKDIDERIDVKRCLSEPYTEDGKTLFEKIDELVEERNHIVHTATRNKYFSDEELQAIVDDFNVAADCIYSMFARIFQFATREIG
ncbi:HEPN domain-containing protein [Bifidobacterium sp. ESL0745]|uniref:HEPN domain-containing protein n=1 Tax=Bifidobacterium sp. ESL0745 TaxID=2983226 RepID=UPI0023F6E54A|nr:HEPN domain-containing protein [Bifidobacterium sp. ESL0745]MDF7665348.1 HEPN domain-containing protein [Bifidobacterium sp. ESL0745]